MESAARCSARTGTTIGVVRFGSCNTFRASTAIGAVFAMCCFGVWLLVTVTLVSAFSVLSQSRWAHWLLSVSLSTALLSAAPLAASALLALAFSGHHAPGHGSPASGSARWMG